MKKITTEKAPAAIGPYSQAVVSGNLVYTSGQIALDPATGVLTGTDITAQTEQVMKNLGEVLEAAGSSFERDLESRTFLSAHIRQFQAQEKHLKHGPRW